MSTASPRPRKAPLTYSSDSGSSVELPARRGRTVGRMARAGQERYFAVGKRRHRAQEDDTEESSGLSSASSDDGSTSVEHEKPVRRGNPAGGGGEAGMSWHIELVIGALLALALGGGIWAYSRYNASASTPADSGSSSSAYTGQTAASPATSQTQHGTLAATGGRRLSNMAGSATATAAPSAGGKSASSGGVSSPGSSNSASSAVASLSINDSPGGDGGDAATGAPDGFESVTLTGSWADTAQYTIATGTYADVPGESSTVALDGLTTSANAAEATKGVIYVGDSTWYAAGEGGYGSCGQMLYDGQEPYFAAMSLYHWMGSPGPSKHCWECVTLQSVADPSKVITAIVADSCEACEFAHVDLEQKAYYALGGTVNSGVVTVAWEFVDCPDGYSEDAVKGLDSSAYKAVDTS